MTKPLIIHLLLILLLLLQYSFSVHKDNYNFGSRLNSLQCQIDNKSAIVKYCYLKAISRRIVYFNLGVTILKRVSRPIHIRLVIYYKYGTIFRQIMDTKQLEWCSIMDGTESNTLLKFLISQLKGSLDDLFHKCPYEGEMDLRNVTLDSSLYDKTTQLFPEGIYRGTIFIIKNDLELGKITVGLELKSPLKETYG